MNPRCARSGAFRSGPPHSPKLHVLRWPPFPSAHCCGQRSHLQRSYLRRVTLSHKRSATTKATDKLSPANSPRRTSTNPTGRLAASETINGRTYQLVHPTLQRRAKRSMSQSTTLCMIHRPPFGITAPAAATRYRTNPTSPSMVTPPMSTADSTSS